MSKNNYKDIDDFFSADFTQNQKKHSISYFFNPDEEYESRSYSEDYASGQYENTCSECGKNFCGSKYRMCTPCKLCAIGIMKKELNREKERQNETI